MTKLFEKRDETVALLGVGKCTIVTAKGTVVVLLEDKPIFDALRMKNVGTWASAVAQLHQNVRVLPIISSVQT